MAKSRKLEQAQSRVAKLRYAPVTPEVIEQWQQVLQSKYASVVAQAAKILGKLGITDLNQDLINAFDRFLHNPAKSDPNCLAKTEIAETLYRLEAHSETLFLNGIRHVQMEPVWGGTVDTAAKLRGNCALGLVRMNYPDVMTELADLLADPEPPARIVAARAITYSENPQGVPLLRLRARMGDEPQVQSEYLAALLKLAPQNSVEFVSGFLSDSNLQVQELVALVLGESRQPKVLEILKAWWQSVREPELSSTGLLAISMLRTNDSFQFLLSVVTEGSETKAKEAIKALDIYRHDPDLWQQVCEASEKRWSSQP